MAAAIQAKINPQDPPNLQNHCTTFREKKDINPSVVDVIRYSKSLSITDRNNLLRQFLEEKN
jgi:hypothetical protein